MLKKDNIFFVISCILLLIVLFIYKKNLNLQLENKLLKLEKKSANTDSYNAELEEKPVYKIGDVFSTIVGLDSEGHLTQQPSLTTENKVLIFSSGNCSFCEDYYPTLDSLARQNPNISLNVVQSDTSPELNLAFLKSNNFAFKMLTVEDIIFDKLNIMYTPTTFVLNSDNTVKAIIDTPVYLEELSNNLKKN